MSKKGLAARGRRAIRDHVIEKALGARQRHGAIRDLASLCRLLEDREFVRYPTTLVFSRQDLEPGEMAHARGLGKNPAEGFSLLIHPCLEGRAEAVCRAAVYQLVRVNYGEMATREEAELFGSTLLGLEIDEYYRSLCDLADELEARDRGGGLDTEPPVTPM